MWRFLAAAAVTLLVPGIAQGDVDFEDEAALRELDAELYGLPRHRHFRRWPLLRRHRHHRPHLRHRHHRTALFEAAPPADVLDKVAMTIDKPDPTVGEDLLAGRHPSVEVKLAHMDQEMNQLRGRHQVATETRGALESDLNTAVLHMNEAVSIKHKMAQVEAQLRAEKQKMRLLEDDQLRLDRTHRHLVASLRHIMEPKIHFAETRLTERQRRATTLEEEEKHWKEKEQKFHSASLAMLQERKAARDKLQKVREEIRKVRHEQLLAEKELESVKHSVSFNVEGYRYARERARAANSQAEKGKEGANKAEISVKRLNRILEEEQRRVDESISHGKDKLKGKIHKLENIEKRSTSRLHMLEEEYGKWKMEEAAWARRLSASKLLSHDASEQYAQNHKEVLDSAQAQAAHDAESDSDWAWDEWPGRGNKQETDEVTFGPN